MNLGEKIALLRKQKNMTQFDLADKLNVSNKMVSKRETNRSLPDVETIKKIADEFEISISELFDCIHDKDVKEKQYDFNYIYKFKKYCFVSLGLIIFSLFLTIIFCVFRVDFFGTVDDVFRTGVMHFFVITLIFTSILISSIMFITQSIYMNEVIKKNPMVIEYRNVYKKYFLSFSITIGVTVLFILIYFILVIIDLENAGINWPL